MPRLDHDLVALAQDTRGDLHRLRRRSSTPANFASEVAADAVRSLLTRSLDEVEGTDKRRDWKG